ncbi:hypothetical protein CEW92_13305 [Bacillaceae bacterium SAS-127]|nr:hypothetical protein CEW92_13305 [Bacillaceae bacterium SAS-127]
MEKTSLYAYIALKSEEFSDFPLEIVTERLGIEPTQTWKTGDRIHPNNPNNPLERSYTRWEFRTDTIETLDTEEVFRPIFDLFESKIDVINQLKEEFDLQASVTLVIEVYDGDTPALVIYPTFSAFVAAIDAAIDVDMYVFSLVPEEE